MYLFLYSNFAKRMFDVFTIHFVSFFILISEQFHALLNVKIIRYYTGYGIVNRRQSINSIYLIGWVIEFLFSSVIRKEKTYLLLDDLFAFHISYIQLEGQTSGSFSGVCIDGY